MDKKIKKTNKKNEGGFFELIRTVFWAVIIAIIFRSLLFEPYNIPSGSMLPNLLVGDYLFVSKYSYGYSRYSFPFGLVPIPSRVLSGNPERGDVVVFKLPSDTSINYIKRLIGLPGDKIQMKNGRLFLNEKVVERRRLDDFIMGDIDGKLKMTPQYLEILPNGKRYKILETWGDNGPLDNTGIFTVPKDHYFMMGDNRDNSQDSRIIQEVGFVPMQNLVGQASIIFFSTNGQAKLWEVWKWPISIRFERLFNQIF